MQRWPPHWNQSWRSLFLFKWQMGSWYEMWSLNQTYVEKATDTLEINVVTEKGAQCTLVEICHKWGIATVQGTEEPWGLVQGIWKGTSASSCSHPARQTDMTTSNKMKSYRGWQRAKEVKRHQEAYEAEMIETKKAACRRRGSTVARQCKLQNGKN